MDFYTSEQVTKHITRIQPFFNDACVYYIRGEEKGLLVDTGYGFGHLKEYVDSIAREPYEVVLTHGHLDHAGGANEWTQVYMNLLDFDLFQKHSELSERNAFLKRYVPNLDEYDESMFVDKYQGDFIDLKDGKEFDLGNVHVQIIHAPGHTKGMSVLLVKEDRTILFGDACGVFTLFVHEEATSLEEYLDTLKKLKDLMPQYDRILRQHGTCESPLSLVDENYDIVASILNGTDDKQPFEFNGQKCFIARKIDINTKGKRLDGKEGNIIYIPEKIHKNK